MTDAQLEMVECAKINLDNLAAQVPGLSEHPFFKIVKLQLDQITED